MDKQHFKASLRIAKSHVTVALDVYLFREDDVEIAYCPALNLSAYGDTTDDAKSEFEFILKEHIEWCLENGTLETDLIQHGWRVGNHSYSAPLATDMLMANDTFRDIVNHKDYHRVMIPQKISSQRAYA